MKGFSINGMYHEGGQERVLKEILLELDCFIKPDQVEVVIPKWVHFEEEYKNIKIVRYGNSKRVIWLQLIFPFYLLRNNKLGVNMFNYCPILRPDITLIHDLTARFLKKKKTTFVKHMVYIYGELCRCAAVKFGKHIITDSKNSKKDIINAYNIDPNKVTVLGTAWQHMERITSDNDIFEKYPMLTPKNYYFSLGSVAVHKNFGWVKEVAKTHKDDMFAIAGAIIASTTIDDKIENSDNMLYLGRVSDGEMKALLENCKGFIFPSFYEGFGIPPLEALSVGAPIIISNTSCLPEIYEDAAHYIDPYNTDVCLNELLKETVAPAEKILSKYSWRKLAEEFYNILVNVCDVKI